MLQRAQRAAVEAVRPGITAEEVDAAARDVLAEAGLEYFVHRTGHGIGLAVHEEPYIVAGNQLPLATGMAFSVEPGVYFPGRWGRASKTSSSSPTTVRCLSTTGRTS